MKSTNKKLIKLLGILDILESEEIKENNPKTESDITYTVSNVAGNESVSPQDKAPEIRPGTAVDPGGAGGAGRSAAGAVPIENQKARKESDPLEIRTPDTLIKSQVLCQLS